MTLSRQCLLSIGIGLLAGWLFFEAIWPILLGEPLEPMFQHGSAIEFLFWIYPFLFVPSTCFFVAALAPRRIRDAMMFGILFTLCFLLPVPLVNEWWYLGPPPLSSDAWVQEKILAIALLVLAIFAASIAGAAGPMLNEALRRRISSGRWRRI